MGQYYNAIISKEPLTQNHIQNRSFNYLCPYAFDNGAKLMEHSWIGNDFVNSVCQLLKDTPRHIVWAGDYADNEPYELKTEMQSGVLTPVPQNLYRLCDDQLEIEPNLILHMTSLQPILYKYLINHSKQLYVDILKTPIEDDWQIHALPLLTCEGNGRGGGDFRGVDSDKLIGSWARDMVEFVEKKPDELFKELIFNLKE